MEVSTFDIPITPVATTDCLHFEAGSVYLWVIHANKIPPHLGISDGASFYSLKANGKDDGLNVSKILPVLQKKNIATVFFEIQPSLCVKSAAKAFADYTTTIPGEITCLQPIKELFDIENALWLKELLEVLEERGGIVSAHGWQLPENFNGIPNYDAKHIHDRLNALANV